MTGEIAPSHFLSAAPHASNRLLPESPAIDVHWSVNEMTTYRWSFPEDVYRYREAGINALGVWRPKLSEFGEERGIELVHELGISISSLSWAGGFTGANGHSYEEAVDDGLEAIDIAARLHADCLVIVSGARAGHTVRHAQRLLTEGLQELSGFAGPRNVPLALQPMHRMFEAEWTFLNSLDATLDIIDTCNNNVGIAFDVYQLWQEPRLLDRIPEIAPRTSVVQLSDWHPPRCDADRAWPGEGEIPLEEIVHAFTDAGYRGHFEIDVWSEALWAADYVELLNRCHHSFAALSGQRSLAKP